MGLINDKIKELEDVAEKKHQTIYEICFRRAGVGIVFYDDERVKNMVNWKNGLYVDSYHKDLETAIDAEISRLSKEE